jgi:hypothetical protein
MALWAVKQESVQITARLKGRVDGKVVGLGREFH